MRTTPRLEAHGVGVRFGDVQALRNVHCSFGGRGVTGLIGVNGAGKTTLIHTLTGLLPVTSGTVARRGRPTDIAYCPDTPAFEPWLTATEVLMHSAMLGRRGNAPLSSGRSGEMLELVGLPGVGHRRVGGFSRGMSQRLGIAASLVRDPAILLLDEPTSALDPVGREDVMALVEQLGRTMRVVFSSHILDDVERVADELLVLHVGLVLFDGDAEDFRRAADDERIVLHLRTGSADSVAELIQVGVRPIIDPTDECKLTIGPDDLPIALRLLAGHADRLLAMDRRRGTLQGAFLAALDAASKPRDERGPR